MGENGQGILSLAFLARVRAVAFEEQTCELVNGRELGQVPRMRLGGVEDEPELLA